jgi:hypothetical protein
MDLADAYLPRLFGVLNYKMSTWDLLPQVVGTLTMTAGVNLQSNDKSDRTPDLTATSRFLAHPPTIPHARGRQVKGVTPSTGALAMAAEYKRSFSKRVWDAEEHAADLEKSLDDSSRYLRVVYDSEGASSRKSGLLSTIRFISLARDSSSDLVEKLNRARMQTPDHLE